MSVDELEALIDRGQSTLAIERAQAALRHAEGSERASLLLALASACIAAGRPLEAMRAGVAASDAWRAAGSREGQCDAIFRIGAALRAAGDHAAAIATVEEAETLAREMGDALRQATALRVVGMCCSVVGRHQQALSQLQEALDLLQAHAAPPSDLAAARLSLLNARSRQAEALPADAPQRGVLNHELAQAFLALADECAASGPLSTELMARGNHAILLRRCGRAAESIDALTLLLPEYTQRGMRPNVALTHVELGHALRELGRHDEAVDAYGRALALLREAGSLDDLAEALEGQSRSEEARGRPADALAALREWCAVGQRKSDEAARAAAAQRELRLELARLTLQWAQQATHDPLTGLGNRRALDHWMSEHLGAVERGEPLTLLLLDLDHFKRINDRFGHATGDAVLERVAAVLASSCRSRDLAVRYGGEEFVLALASVDPEQALDVAHRLRASIQTQDWASLGAGLAVSVSIGVADAREAADLTTLLALADKRLYAAKYAGRNQVVAA